jgi:hypothetical protein
MSSFTLVVQIAREDLHILEAAKYNICLAKNINFNNAEHAGNVVFSSVTTKQLAQKLTFKWEENYQVSELNNFEVFRLSDSFLLVLITHKRNRLAHKLRQTLALSRSAEATPSPSTATVTAARSQEVLPSPRSRSSTSGRTRPGSLLA